MADNYPKIVHQIQIYDPDINDGKALWFRALALSADSESRRVFYYEFATRLTQDVQPAWQAYYLGNHSESLNYAVLGRLVEDARDGRRLKARIEELESTETRRPPYLDLKKAAV